jgi:hypothetical protein
MTGTIILADGNGTIIKNGQITTSSVDAGNINANSQIIYNSLEIVGNTVSTSPDTGTLIVQGVDNVGGGIGCGGNIHVGKSLYLTDVSHNVYTQNITQVSNDAPIKLYNDTANPQGIFFGNAETPLYIYSPIELETGQFTNIIVENLTATTSLYSNFIEPLTGESQFTIANNLTTGNVFIGSETSNIYMQHDMLVNTLDANLIFPPSKVKLYPTYDGHIQLGDQFTNTDISGTLNANILGSDSVSIHNVAISNNVIGQDIICSNIQTNNIQVNNNLTFLKSMTSTTCGSLVGYITVQIGGNPFKIPYYNV